MSSKESALSPNPWFETEGTYSGDGEVHFTSPVGVVYGPATVRFADAETPSIDLQVLRADSGAHLTGGILQLLSGVEPMTDAATSSAHFDAEALYNSNHCSTFCLQDGAAVVRAVNRVYVNGTNISASNSAPGLSIRLELLADVISYETNIGTEPAYWILPLVNFVSDFRDTRSELDRHPLRIFPVPLIESQLSPHEAVEYGNYVRQHNNLIVFDDQGSSAFIEALPDYDERVQQLKSGQRQRLITAVMVAKLRGHQLDFTSIQEWLPLRLLALLSVASGHQVGTPWVEFRDQQGRLVQRTHMMTRMPSYSEGHKSIREIHHHGTGRLLTNALKAASFKDDHFGTILKFTMDGSSQTGTIEDNLSSLFRALDSLAEHYGLATQYFANLLDSTHAATVKQAVSQARQALQSASNAAFAAGDPQQSRLLRKIADRISNAQNKDRDFGLAVCDLLARFGLPDADVIDAHYTATATSGSPKKWNHVLTTVRGTTMHTGYFRASPGPDVFGELVTIQRHLHDVLLRIAFQIYEYDGTYQPVTITRPVVAPIDWVTGNTPAGLLGYS